MTPAAGSSTSARPSRSASASPATSATRRCTGRTALTDEVDHIETLVVATEAEALLTEQTFIKQYKPRFNIRLRDDKSYPYIAISLDEEFPRVYFTRERHRRDRAYFGPYTSAKRVRGTLDLLGKIFQLRSCEGPEPGRHSGSPCLDYYIKRCGAPCVGYVSKEEYRQGIDGVVAFLSGRFKQIERDLEQRMYFRAGEQDYEAAALDRNRLQAVRALLERQRVANEGAGTYDAVAVACEGTEANAQVFQVRDGVLSDRQSFYLDNHGEQPLAVVVEEFILQYYASALSIPSLLVVQSELEEGSEIEILEQILAERRGGSVEIRPAERGAKRRILDLAARNARLALDQEKLKAERRRQQRVEALDGLQQALAPRSPAGADRVLRHLAHRRHAHRRLDGRVRGRSAEEVRLQAFYDPGGRSGGRLRCHGGGPFTPVRAVGEAVRALPLRRRARRVLRRAPEPDRHRRRQGPARRGSRAAAGLPRARRRGRLARQADRGGLPARATARRSCSRTTRRSCSCCSASATRRTGSRSRITGSGATRR